ncbi:NADP-dependent oxidoreductase [Dactylosporangium fulvum]
MHAYGDPSVIRVDDVPVPVPAPGEVLVEVAATSFNPSEVGLRAGLLRDVFDLDLPHTLGWDVAGTVVDTGERVVARLDTGTAAEFVAADPALLVPAPVSVPLAHAAALPVAGLTAWQAVVGHAEVHRGQRVLVNGAGGGIGGYAVQLAKRAGAYVIATASARSAGVLRALGADEIVDYTRVPLHEALAAPVDTVLHLVGREMDLVPLVRPGGRIVSVTTPVHAPPATGVTAVHFVVGNTPGDLAALVRLVDDGAVRLDVSAEYRFEDLPAVHRAAEAGALRGKVIVTP